MSYVECKKAMTTSLLNLNDFALLQVFSYLNFRDSINFADTSKRLKSVGGLHFSKYKRFDLLKYEHSGYYRNSGIPPETILSHIGQHVTILSIDTMRSTVAEAVMDNCVNVTTLNIYDRDDTSRLEVNWKKWMQQLKLESLTIDRCSHFNGLSVGQATLKELHFTGGNDCVSAIQLRNILEKTTELETLEVHLTYQHFNFDIFSKLPNLKCLDVRINSADLVDLTKFLKMDVLTQFKLHVILSDAETLTLVNSFLEILAERGNLNELQLNTTAVDQNTFRILKSFHLTSLGFYASYYVDHKRDERWMMHYLVEAQPNLKHLDFLHKFQLIEHVDFLVKNLVKLETFTFRMTMKDLRQLQIDEMLKTSTSRPILTLYINYHAINSVKIELRFEQRKHRIIRSENARKAKESYFLIDAFTGRV